ncbi:MAG: hypothetical protein LBJ00_09685 [Planctomycetaceae bacterium]|nr:hypothetical protein [Planctomycetaceae bacterium]
MERLFNGEAYRPTGYYIIIRAIYATSFVSGLICFVIKDHSGVYRSGMPGIVDKDFIDSHNACYSKKKRKRK